MKHVRESLSQYYDYKFFKMVEEDNKSKLQDKEKDGLAVINKLKKNFEDFKKNAKGEISAYKTFWEENKKAKEAFTESGNIYKLFDRDFAAGVLELPPQILSDGSLDGGFGATDEPEEEIIEGVEIESTEKSEGEFFEEQHVPTNEAEEAEEGEDLDLDLDLGDDEEPEDLEAPAKDNEKDVDLEVDMDTDNAGDADVNIDSEMEEPMPSGDVSLTQSQAYFVVYDITGEGREEILRCGSNNVVNAFNEFYSDTFKASMKNAIIKYKERKEVEKREAEKSEKKKQESSKESKLKKFLGNN